MRDGAWRHARLARARLYLCSGALDAGEGLARLLDAVMAEGVDLVQLRDKEADPATLRAAARVIRAAAGRHAALFIVNDDPALAVAVDADGVHVGQDDAPPDQARAVVGSERLVGRSTHTTAEFDAGLAEDCDYLAVGPVHATPTKAGRPPVGLGPVRHAAASATSRPWFVTGAMAPDTAGEVVAAGGRRLVVVRALTEAPDPAGVARTLTDLLGSPKRGPQASR